MMEDVSELVKRHFNILHKGTAISKTVQDRKDVLNNARKAKRETLAYLRRNINENMSPIVPTPAKNGLDRKAEKTVDKSVQVATDKSKPEGVSSNRLELLKRWKLDKEKAKEQAKANAKPIFKVCHVPSESTTHLDNAIKLIKGKPMAPLAKSKFAPPNHTFRAPSGIKPIAFTTGGMKKEVFSIGALKGSNKPEPSKSATSKFNKDKGDGLIEEVKKKTTSSKTKINKRTHDSEKAGPSNRAPKTPVPPPSARVTRNNTKAALEKSAVARASNQDPQKKSIGWSVNRKGDSTQRTREDRDSNSKVTYRKTPKKLKGSENRPDKSLPVVEPVVNVDQEDRSVNNEVTDRKTPKKLKGSENRQDKSLPVVKPVVNIDQEDRSVNNEVTDRKTPKKLKGLANKQDTSLPVVEPFVNQEDRNVNNKVTDRKTPKKLKDSENKLYKNLPVVEPVVNVDQEDRDINNKVTCRMTPKKVKGLENKQDKSLPVVEPLVDVDQEDREVNNEVTDRKTPKNLKGPENKRRKSLPVVEPVVVVDQEDREVNNEDTDRKTPKNLKGPENKRRKSLPVVESVVDVDQEDRDIKNKVTYGKASKKLKSLENKQDESSPVVDVDQHPAYPIESLAAGSSSSSTDYSVDYNNCSNANSVFDSSKFSAPTLQSPPASAAFSFDTPPPLYVSPFVTISRGKDSARKEYKIRRSQSKCDIDEEFKDTPEAKKILSAHTSPVAGAAYFKRKLDIEFKRITEIRHEWETYLAGPDVPEDACSSINCALGQSKLLITKKFQQLRGLIRECETQNYELKPVTCEDLHGYWDMLYMQVDDVDKRFANLQNLKDNNWEEIMPVKVAPVKRARGRPKKAQTKSKIMQLIQEAKKKKTAEKAEHVDIINGLDYAKILEMRTPSKERPHEDGSNSTKRRSIRVSVLKENQSRCSSSPGLTMMKVSQSIKQGDGLTPARSILKTDLHKSTGKKSVVFKENLKTSPKPFVKANLFMDMDKENDKDLISFSPAPLTPRRRSTRRLKN